MNRGGEEVLDLIRHGRVFQTGQSLHCRSAKVPNNDVGKVVSLLNVHDSSNGGQRSADGKKIEKGQDQSKNTTILNQWNLVYCVEKIQVVP